MGVLETPSVTAVRLHGFMGKTWQNDAMRFDAFFVHLSEEEEQSQVPFEQLLEHLSLCVYTSPNLLRESRSSPFPLHV